MDIEQGFKKFKELIKVFGDHNLIESNEAETRKKVIDGILEKVLGWKPVDDIKYEERVSEDGKTQFADYIINTATTGIIVEAKRAGRSFELPVKKTSASLGGVISEGEVGKAIRQVRDYCRKTSIPFAVATNGIAWIIFPAVRTDKIPFESTNAIIFRSLEDIKERFIEFWELLSRQRVIEGNLESVLFGDDKDSSERKLISSVKEPSFRLGRNNVFKHIEPAVAIALTDEALLEDPDALDACYVKSTDRIKYDKRLKMHLADRKPPLDRKVVRTQKRSNKDHLDNTIKNSDKRLPQFILLLGPVGAGKTTFLHYTRKVSAKDSIDDEIVWLYLDFKRATPSDNPRDFIYEELLRLIEQDSEFELGSWEKTIRPAYEEFIRSLRIGPLNPLYNASKEEFDKEISKRITEQRDEVEPYVNKILKYVAEDNQIFIVIDNVDQLEDSDYQSNVFIEGQAVARKVNSSIIMSLRDSTYFKHRNSPLFDAFQVDTIYIDPPSVLPVLSRRFAYAQKQVVDESASILSERGFTINVDDLGVFFKIVSSSLLEEENGYMIEVMSGGNIRRALSLIREFLASGHISADKALKTYLSKGNYHFPTHEVFKGMIFGQKKFYREEESIIRNIFDSKLGRKNLQLLRLQILGYLVRSAADVSFDGISFELMKNDLYRLGIQNADSEKVVEDLISNSALRTTDGRPLHDNSKLIPTRFGGYWIKEMAIRFDYLEPCLIDANIYDDEIWKKLSAITDEVESNTDVLPRIEKRLERVRVFIDYLLQIEQHWIIDCKRLNLELEWDNEFISSSKDAIEQELNSVSKSAKRHYS